MTFDNELKLIGIKYEQDEWRNKVEVRAEKTVLCNLESVTRNEFYNASVTGYKPELIFVMHAYEYDNEQKVEYEGKEYKVIRTYRRNFEELELICGEVLGNG